jgi:SAM-dependent methyltransferase
MSYTCLDIEAHSSVDVVMKPGDTFPFPDESFDLIISTSCFEHDPCFWMTFREMCRVVKKSGYIYVNAPSNGIYHTFPGDNWRFYSDAGQALAYWSGKELDGKSWPVKVVETFHILPKNDIWTDFICIWQRTDEKENNIVVSDEIKNKIGPLRQALHGIGFSTKTKF